MLELEISLDGAVGEADHEDGDGEGDVRKYKQKIKIMRLPLLVYEVGHKIIIHCACVLDGGKEVDDMERYNGHELEHDNVETENGGISFREVRPLGIST